MTERILTTFLITMAKIFGQALGLAVTLRRLWKESRLGKRCNFLPWKFLLASYIVGVEELNPTDK